MNIEEAFKHYDVTGDIEPLVDIFGDENLVHSLLGIVPVGCNNCMRYSKCEIRDYLGDCHFDAHKCKRFKIRYNIHRDKKSFVRWQEENQESGNLFPPSLEPQMAINFLVHYILGDDWYIADPLGVKQVNVPILHNILWKVSKKYRKEYKKYLKKK